MSYFINPNFETFRPDSIKEKIAKIDIDVYKIINIENKSEWKHFQYVPNTLYRLRKKLNLEQKAGLVTKLNYYKIDEGFHSYDKNAVETQQIVPFLKLVKFIIPKGAKYYYNSRFGEYVSSSIRSGDLTDLWLDIKSFQC